MIITCCQILYNRVGEELEIDEQFEQYKNITLIIMETVKAENYEKLDELFLQRQLILNNINKFNSSKEELNKLYIKYNVGKSDKILEEEMKNRKDELLDKIKENQKRKIGMNGYNNFQARAVFLSKEL